jgi:hypothetical protein
MTLNRSDILSVVDILVKEVDVPEWGGTVFIRQLTRGEQDTYLKRQYGATRLTQHTKNDVQEISAVDVYGHDAFICSRGICDDAGKLLFKEGDVEALKSKNGAVIGRLSSEIVKFSGMAGDIQAAEDLKNSLPTPIDSSTTD